MSNREITARTIHPDSIAELGLQECIVALEVARDLRSGAIPPEDYDQDQLYPLVAIADGCGTPCCIAAHIAHRMRVAPDRIFNKLQPWIYGLFSSRTDSLQADDDPIHAADAIERYVYDGDKQPWRTDVS